jgi:ribose 1,5-bisphosphokinase
MAKPGCFVLVVGPSGAGKDTLIAGAAERLSGDTRFVFPHRLITRQALPEAEAHDTISRAEFDRMVKTGDFALCWEAHGLGYVIPKAIANTVSEGRIAVCNASRRIVPDAMNRFAGTKVIHVDAIPIIRATRLAARGRESAEEIEQRLARDVPRFPVSVPVIEVDNSGAIDEGVASFITALLGLAEAMATERKHA